MGSFVLRWKGWADGYSLLRRFSAGISRSRTSTGGGWRKMSMVTNSADESNSESSPFTLPWLMLPPAFEGGDKIVFNFYSIAEKKVVRQVVGGEWAEELRSLSEVKFVGSSHGWLALFNERNCDMFLLNPLSDRRIKLPPIHTLSDPQINLRAGAGGGRGIVSKVIVSCSPSKEECRAVMSFGPGDRLAYCLPGRSKGWAPFGDPFLDDDSTLIERVPFLDDYSTLMERDTGEEVRIKYARVYADFLYWGRERLLTCVTQQLEMEDWDLSDLRYPGFPHPYGIQRLRYGGDDFVRCSWVLENWNVLRRCAEMPYLVYAEQLDQHFLVTRFVDEQKRGSYKTVGFVVQKIDSLGTLTLELEEENSLDGLAMFIGINHSFAISAAEFPQVLKPNSIYFTHDREFTPSDFSAGYDVGIFDYENKTLSPFCCDYQITQTIAPAPPPLWFTPSFH